MCQDISIHPHGGCGRDTLCGGATAPLTLTCNRARTRCNRRNLNTVPNSARQSPFGHMLGARRRDFFLTLLVYSPSTPLQSPASKGGGWAVGRRLPLEWQSHLARLVVPSSSSPRSMQQGSRPIADTFGVNLLLFGQVIAGSLSRHPTAR